MDPPTANMSQPSGPPMPTSPFQAYYQTPGHVIAAAVVFAVIDVSAVALRFVARKRQKLGVKADDWFMLLGTIFTLVIAINIIWGVSKRGLAYPMEFPEGFAGNPLAMVTDQMSATLKTQFIFVLMIPLALGCIKLSILLFYIRIFAITRASLTWVLLAIFTVFAAVWTVAFFFAELFQCGTSIWALTSSAYDIATQCPGTQNIDFSLALTDFVTDVFIFFLPIPLIWRMKLSTGNKFAVSGVFLLGSSTIIASTLRLVSVVHLMKTDFDPNMDGILLITEFLYWGLIEAGTGVLAGSLPTFQVLFRKLPWESMLLSIRNVIPSKLSSSWSVSSKARSTGTNSTTGSTKGMAAAARAGGRCAYGGGGAHDQFGLDSPPGSRDGPYDGSQGTGGRIHFVGVESGSEQTLSAYDGIPGGGVTVHTSTRIEKEVV